MNNEKPLSIQRDEERMHNLAPRRDAGPVSEADVFAGAPQDRDAKRVRDARVAQFVDWHRRAKGRVPTDVEVAKFLGGGGQQ
jgi:hypothetical protein